MSDPYGVPSSRRPSAAPLVDRIRGEVDAWRDGGYAGASETSARLLRHWFHDDHVATDSVVPFRWYFAQRDAIETLVYLHEIARTRRTGDLIARYASLPVAAEGQPYPRYVFKMATGSGKTKVMSLAVVWSYFHALREPDSPMSTTSLVVAPNLIVYERLREDFAAGKIFKSDPLIPPDWARDFDLQIALRGDPVPMGATGVLVLTNVQQLYERESTQEHDPVSTLLGPRPRTSRPEAPVLEQVAARGRVLVLNDEAHHLHDETNSETGEPLVAIRSLRRLDELADRGISAQLDFSATPKDVQGRLFAETVVDYPLSQAIEDGIVKRPIIGEISGGAPEVVSDDASIRYRQRLQAGIAKWRSHKEAMEPAGHKPLMFVMAENTAAADQIATYLETQADLTGRVLTIHVNVTGRQRGEVRRGELEQAREWARQVDSDDNPYSAIVSVLMLREGWDVRNVTVIVPLRPLTATNQILPEQTLGRGLRRMTPPGSGVDESVVVIEHEAFRRLWDDVLIDPEYQGIERAGVDAAGRPPQVIAVEPDRLEFDIEIPQLPRVLQRQAANLRSLRVSDIQPRQLPLPEDVTTDLIHYVGRDILTGEEVERAVYALERPQDPSAVLAWYVNELQRDARLTGQFAVLAPVVKSYVEERFFDRNVPFDEGRVLAALAEPAVQEMLLAVLKEAVNEATLAASVRVPTDYKAAPLSATKPFLWSGQTVGARKSLFNLQPCDSGLEIRIAQFLDRCADVAAFAKLAREMRFSLEYRAEGGRLAFYYPDFVARSVDDTYWVIEAKGRVDADVPRKDERAARWAVDATIVSGDKWSYMRVDEELFESHEAALADLSSLAAAVHARRRESVRANLRSKSTDSKAKALGLLEQLQSRLGSGTDLDEESRQFRGRDGD